MREPADGVLLGRTTELAVLADFVRAATRSGGVHLVTGDAGMGKSALLWAAARVAEQETDARVLHASGVEFEADVGHAGLNQLLLPLAEELPALSEPDAEALRPVLGPTPGEVPDLLPLTSAVLTLLRRLRRSRPVLVVIDDLQWIDPSTLLLLSLVARRLDGTGVALLLAKRSGHETVLDAVPVHTLELAPLADEDADALLRAHYPRLHPSVRRRVVADAGGNPLALVELPRGLTAAQEAAADILPSTLPLSVRLRRLFAARISALPPSSRLLLLLAALHHGDQAELMRIVAASSTDLAPAETAGLVAVDPATRHLRFSHPLVRAAVVDLASAPERRSAHRRLSQLTAVAHVRALHLAESVVGTDDRVAALLDEVAEAALTRGDPGRAVSVLLRAADLTAAPADRARRLAAAAYLDASVVGTLTGAGALLARARSADPDATNTLQLATAAAAHLLNTDRGIDTPHRVLVRALAAVPPDCGDSRAVQDAVRTLMLVCAFGGRAELWTAFHEVVDTSTRHLSPALRLAAVTFADPARATPRQLAAVDELVAAADGSADPVQVLEVALAGHWVDREPTAALDRVARAGRRGGPVPLAVQALGMLAVRAFHEGRWDEAVELSDEGISLCVEHGYRRLESEMLNPRMLVAAARGDSLDLARSGEWLARPAGPRQMPAARGLIANADGLAELTRGRYAEAHEAYSSIAEPGTLPPYARLTVRNGLDVVEAAVRSGHLEEARRHARVIASALAPISPRLRFQAEAAAALVAPDAEYAAAYDRLLDDPRSARWPFDLARAELAYGERLRRDRAMRRARPHLERAVELFADLRSEPWAARADAVLRATGRTRRPAHAGDAARLTPQELQVARLAATGLSNREIGERMFLSPRTVGAHLYRAFPKLVVTSRAGLRDALSQYAD